MRQNRVPTSAPATPRASHLRIALEQIHRAADRRYAKADVHRVGARNVEVEDLLHDAHLLLDRGNDEDRVESHREEREGCEQH